MNLPLAVDSPDREPHRRRSIRWKHTSRLVVGLALLACGCDRPTNDPATKSPSGFRNETHFIVHSIVADLSAMGHHASGQGAGPPVSPRTDVVEKPDSPLGRPVYSLRLASGPNGQRFNLDLVVDRPIWEPSLYAPLVTRLFPAAAGTAGPTPAATNGGPGLLVQLAQFDAESLEAANQSVSRSLVGDFLNPRLHQQAALVLGAFGLREASGDFYDVRGVLCRMTAHLAVAGREVGASVGTPEGAVAEAMLYTLMGNQRDALGKLARLDSGPEVRPWKRALQARVTGDYRELEKETGDLTNLERVCWFEACARSVDTRDAWERQPEAALRSQPEFCRIANGLPLSVQLGHVLNDLALPLEQEELRLVLGLTQQPHRGSEPDLRLLNATPEPCVTVGRDGRPVIQVIGRGHWGLFLQRHLCHTLQQNFRFLMRMWGVPEAAAEYSRQTDATFGHLRLYPFVRLANATTQPVYQAAADDCGRLVLEIPHSLGPRLWNLLHQHPPELAQYVPPGLWDISDWHKHNPPPFTAYHVRPRCNHRSLIHHPEVLRHLEALHERAPYDPDVTRALLHHEYGDLGANAPAEALEKAFGPVLEYSVPQMVRVARLVTNNPPAFERFMARAAAHKPLHYFDLGDYFARCDQRQKAADYYEKGVENCPDEVGVSNNSGWLVRYYFDEGRLPEAEQLADRVADAYSFRGLQTKGNLLFWQGRYDESLAWYLKIEERYGNPGVITDWWADYRGGTNDTRYDAVVEKRLKALFPRGVEKVTLSSFDRRPDEGVLIDGENERTQAAGLTKGDIIVALDGRRVYDMPQYIYVRTKLRDPTMRLIVWHDRGYREVTASLADHRFGVPFRTFSRLR